MLFRAILSSSTKSFKPHHYHHLTATTTTTTTKRSIHLTSPIMTSAKLRKQDLPKNILDARYAVRGEIVLKALEKERELASGSDLPFDKVVYCNIGNPQELGQKPITWVRQVLSLVEYPALLEHSSLPFPKDAIERARHYLSLFPSSGAYSHSQGIEAIRRDIASFIASRDAISDPSYVRADDIFITDGASPAVQTTLKLLIAHPNDGIMIPIPQYPLYSASITLLGGQQVPYYLNEEDGWSLSLSDLNKALEEGKKKGVEVKAIAVINPGNPTGSCLDRSNMEEVIKFCDQQGLILMADEVYQENIYNKDEKEWLSFKKVLWEMDEKYSKSVQLFSYHSVSKGMMGECGKRGGYMEITNIHPDVKSEIYKLASVNLCPNIIGQLVMSLMTNPPKQGDESYDLYSKEISDIYESLKRRAKLVSETLNSLEGVKCNDAEAAMYAFPQITLPEKAVEAAKKENKAADLFYCLKLLDATGLVVVPGSGFGQKENTYHFRTTFLPQEKDIKQVLERLKTFHESFMKQYGSSSD